MSSAPDLLTQYGLPIIFGWAFAVQVGAPAPALPMLIGAGVLSGAGRLDLALAIAAAMAATLAADVLWYWLGRFHGTRVLELLCRFSLDPDSLIRRAKERFVAHRLRYLVLAKFLPGANPLAAGLAGAVPIRLDRFVLYAAAGALLWAGAWMTLGYLCADVIVPIATAAGRLGAPLVLVIVAALVVYLAYKIARRQRFLRHLRKARMTPIELNQRLQAGDHPVIFDLRTKLDIETTPYGIPGAHWISVEALDEPQQLIHWNSEVVFYCAEPKERRRAPTGHSCWPATVIRMSTLSREDSMAGARLDSSLSRCRSNRSLK
jgi:membrane protein DedA with SNARE-associated domain